MSRTHPPFCHDGIRTNLPHLARVYSPYCLEGRFSEVLSSRLASVEFGGLLSDNEGTQPGLRIRRRMGRRRRGFDEFDEETREPVPSGSGGGWIVAATFIKYAAIVIVVLIIAYVVLRVLGVLQSSV